MLVNLTKDEMKTIIFYLIGDTNTKAVSIVDKLQPILDACECQAQKQTSSPNWHVTHPYVNNYCCDCNHINCTLCLQSSPIMNNYSEKDYPNLYQEILKDYHWTWGKFNPNNYPSLNETIKSNWRDHNDN